uniref:Uncharacterized protein n=1 Tax=Chrysemys picta bellii TaxID=8478 RepID=A0A8C3I9V8_CHRPI
LAPTLTQGVGEGSGWGCGFQDRARNEDVGSVVGPGMRGLGCRMRLQAGTRGWGTGEGAGSRREIGSGRGLRAGTVGWGAGSGREFGCGRGLRAGEQEGGERCRLRDALTSGSFPEAATCPWAPR